MRQHPRFQIRALALAAALGATFGVIWPAAAQLSSATVRGSVTTAGAPLPGGATVTATNTANGQVSRVATRPDGSYTLVGLQPGTYRVEIAAPGFAPKTDQLTVLVGQTVDLDATLAAAGPGGAAAAGAPNAELNKVTVVGSQSIDRKTSEVGTNVTTKQIDALPQVTRNFLSFADLAPGVRFDVDANGFVKVQSGAQNQDNINVFIDGVSQKNNILRGGAAGIDSTRGNPFPQSAIAEYKVISQNYKAEFDQVSSAAITAVTKSGTNTLHGDVFWDHTGQNLTAYTPNEKLNQDKGRDRVSFSQDQYGLTLGGPIKQDVAHWFLAYEGKDIGNSRTLNFANVQPPIPNAGFAAGFVPLQGSILQKFHEDLLFGKVDLDLGADQRLEASARVRREKDHLAEDKTLSAPGNEKSRKNDETRLDLKHEWTTASFLNEARIGYERYEWSPNADSRDNEIRYFISPANVQTGATEFIRTGGSPDAQDKKQTAFLLQNDLTYTAFAGHTIKGGAKVKFARYDLSGSVRGVDVYQKLIDNASGNPVLFNGNDYFQLDRATSPSTLGYNNKQFGLYLQDDWAVTKRLELNLGVRWDYETNMLDNAYVTPAARVAALFGLEPVDAAGASTRIPGFAVTPGQTYDQSLAKAGINLRDYIADGSSRKPFAGAIQPRLGFSYDLSGDQNLVAFGGIGRAYDRTIADYAIAELSNNSAASGDVYLIRNSFKMPYTDQFSLGLRKGVGVWNTEVGYTFSDSHNQFNWTEGNRDPAGGLNAKPPSDALFGGPPNFGNLILGDFNGRAKTQTVYVKADKPYTRSSGWGFGITYTFSDARTTNANLTNDAYNFSGERAGSRFYPSKDVERHRVVASGVVDGWLPWGILLSGKATLGSGLPFRGTDCTQGLPTCFVRAGEGHAFRQFDVGIGKELGQEVGLPLGRFTLRADIINLFNTVNYIGGYDGFIGVGGSTTYGVPNGSEVAPTRTVKLSMRYAF